jgi:hypothetical protein
LLSQQDRQPGRDRSAAALPKLSFKDGRTNSSAAASAESFCSPKMGPGKENAPFKMVLFDTAANPSLVVGFEKWSGKHQYGVLNFCL